MTALKEGRHWFYVLCCFHCGFRSSTAGAMVHHWLSEHHGLIDRYDHDQPAYGRGWTPTAEELQTAEELEMGQ